MSKGQFTRDWTDEDDIALLQMVENGSGFWAMAEEFEVPEGECAQRVKYLRDLDEKHGGIIEPPPPTTRERTSAGLRDTLFDTLEDLRRGHATPEEAKAVSDVAKTICATVKLEMEAEKMRAALNVQGDPKVLTLGHK